MQKQPYYGPESSDSELTQLCKAAVESCCAEGTLFRDAETYIDRYLRQNLFYWEAVCVDVQNPWRVNIEIDFGLRKFKCRLKAEA